eukprot:355261-Chlamydomonas_euryale.AAC.6
MGAFISVELACGRGVHFAEACWLVFISQKAGGDLFPRSLRGKEKQTGSSVQAACPAAGLCKDGAGGGGEGRGCKGGRSFVQCKSLQGQGGERERESSALW